MCWLTSLELGVVAGEGDIADAGEGHVGTVLHMDGTLEGGTSRAGEGETGSGGRTRHTAMPPTEASIPATEIDCTASIEAYMPSTEASTASTKTSLPSTEVSIFFAAKTVREDTGHKLMSQPRREKIGRMHKIKLQAMGVHNVQSIHSNSVVKSPP